MCDIVFEKTQGGVGKLNRTSAYAKAAVRRVLYKRIYEKFPSIQKIYICAEIPYNKVELC